ncbi:CDP-alcohol phosphatidyltransferase family protein [Lactovum odontotermitis]
MRNIATGLTLLRIAGAFLLLLTTPLSPAFWTIYTLCFLTDVLDGQAARRSGTTSQSGAILDSLADFILIIILLTVFIPEFHFENWIILWTIGIAAVRLLSWLIGFIKYHSFASIHTVLNKMTGFVIFIFPILYALFDLKITMILLCAIASASAVEELLIIAESTSLNRNQKTFLK